VLVLERGLCFLQGLDLALVRGLDPAQLAAQLLLALTGLVQLLLQLADAQVPGRSLLFPAPLCLEQPAVELRQGLRGGPGPKRPFFHSNN
jgi:hypothetical protein